jgi:hypothetical protein
MLPQKQFFGPIYFLTTSFPAVMSANDPKRTSEPHVAAAKGGLKRHHAIQGVANTVALFCRLKANTDGDRDENSP